MSFSIVTLNYQRVHTGKSSSKSHPVFKNSSCHHFLGSYYSILQPCLLPALNDVRSLPQTINDIMLGWELPRISPNKLSYKVVSPQLSVGLQTMVTYRHIDISAINLIMKYKPAYLWVYGAPPITPRNQIHDPSNHSGLLTSIPRCARPWGGTGPRPAGCPPRWAAPPRSPQPSDAGMGNVMDVQQKNVIFV